MSLDKEGLMQYYRNNVFSTDLDVEIYFAVDDFVRYDYDDAGMINHYTSVIAQNIDRFSPIELIEKNMNVAATMYTEHMEGNLKNYIIEKLNIE